VPPTNTKFSGFTGGPRAHKAAASESYINYWQSGGMEKILLTRAGYEKLIRELEFLSQVERPQVVREILEAAQEGRVEKNPDFQSALVHRRQLERRIRPVATDPGQRRGAGGGATCLPIK